MQPSMRVSWRNDLEEVLDHGGGGEAGTGGHAGSLKENQQDGKCTMSLKRRKQSKKVRKKRLLHFLNSHFNNRVVDLGQRSFDLL